MKTTESRCNGWGGCSSSCLLLLLVLCLSAFVPIAAKTHHHHHFVVQETQVERLCENQTIVTVNGMLPGPTLRVRNGDSLVINVVNKARYNITIHWHGVRQLRTAWADGMQYVTQCPIRPGGRYTHRFTITDQEGTIWWHAHSSWLRATVHGAIIIYPKKGSSYPFEKPNRDFPVMLGEWWNANPVDVVDEAMRNRSSPPAVSNAFTINGQPGDLYNCSANDTTVFPVRAGEKVLLRVINAALNQELFFAVGGHQMTVVGADASYTKRFNSSFLRLGPGQTTDVLITTNQPPGRYYMAARAFNSADFPLSFIDNTTTTAVLEYREACHPSKSSPSSQGCGPPVLPTLPPYNDTNAARSFAAGYKSLSKVKVPAPVDASLLFTVGLGLFNCTPEDSCNDTYVTASMNNVSFVFPTNFSILQAHHEGIEGVFTPNFPPVPPYRFNYTSADENLRHPIPGTEVLRLKYGTKVQLVMQGTNIVAFESHPMHIHGFDFYVLATGTGNFNATTDIAKFNMVDPPQRNTVAVPAGGWTAIRFVADNPGAWLMHCHLDLHLTWGLAMVFLVDNGVGEMQSLGPPPPDLPKC